MPKPFHGVILCTNIAVAMSEASGYTSHPRKDRDVRTEHGVRKNEFSTVLVPLIRKELSDLNLLFFMWACDARRITDTSLPKLLLTLDADPDQVVKAEILRAIEIFQIDKKFSDIEIKDCAMPASENIYVRHGHKPPEVIPKFGFKSGPNSQFLTSLLHLAKDANTVLLNEVDCYPLREDWHSTCQRVIADSEPFWILGSPYRGRGRAGPEVLQHINGNAFYGIGTPGANNFFFNLLPNELLHRIKTIPDLAYDVVFSSMFQDVLNPALWSSASQTTFRLYPNVATRVRATDLIHNLAGTEEINGKSSYDINDYARAWPAVRLVHGGFLKSGVVKSIVSNWSSYEDIPIGKKIAFAEQLWNIGQKAASRRIVDAICSGPRSRVGPSNRPLRCLAFSLHESGGDGFYRLLSRVADFSRSSGTDGGFHYESIPDELYQQGMPEGAWKDDPSPSFLGERLNKVATIFGGFRFVPRFISDELLDTSVVFVLVRDPRDVLTSLYFSLWDADRFTQSMTIDEFVLTQAHQGDWVERYRRLWHVWKRGWGWRYEDLAISWEHWLKDMLLGLDIDLPICKQAEILAPESCFADPSTLLRFDSCTVPGAHRRLLKNDTVKELSYFFSDALDNWQYF